MILAIREIGIIPFFRSPVKGWSEESCHAVVISASGMRPIVILNHSRPFQDGRWNDIPVEELQK